jgi:glycerol-3-phosphate acyltransferase PlsX
VTPEAGPVVALDGFGAEQGFDVLAEGARQAAADGIALRIFGSPEHLELDGVDGIEVIPTTDAITNDDHAVTSVRSKPDSSIVRAAADVAAGHSQALASVGPTGATMAAATLGLRRMQGVQRPALAVQLPIPGAHVLFLDVGANVEVRAQHLVQFAFLGAAFSAAVLDVPAPRVGLLSVGEESGKGTPIVADAHGLLSDSPGIDFIGNVEGRDLTNGAADVVVTDGFTGNVALKLMEGTVKAITDAVRTAAKSNPVAAAGGLMLRPSLGDLRRDLSPDNTGGAVLLGLRRVAVVGHGSSSAEGVANAVRVAAESVRADSIERTGALMRKGGVGRGSLAAAESD